MNLKHRKSKILKVWIGFALVFLLIATSLMIPTLAAQTDVVVNGDFDPTLEGEIQDIDWNVHNNPALDHYDGAYSAQRAIDALGEAPAEDSHIQFKENSVYFFGYYTNWISDYIYYKETDPNEKTFSFKAEIGLYNNSSVATDLHKGPRTWHSIFSFGFWVNCVVNADGTVSGYYLAFEGLPSQSSADRVVVRMLDHVNLAALSGNSQAILAAPIVYTENIPNLFDNFEDPHSFVLKSSSAKFSVVMDGAPLYSFDLATADAAKKPSGYTGGNDFGFYCGYAGSTSISGLGGHTCAQLSYAIFSDVKILTQSITPKSDLNVRFVDYKTRNNTTPSEIDSVYNSTGYVGQDYTVKTPAKIGKYTYVSAKGALTGLYANATQEVALYYVNPTLKVRYVDENGKLLEAETFKDGLNLGAQTATAKAFSGYTLKSDKTQSVTLTADNPDGVIAFKYAKETSTINSPKTDDRGFSSLLYAGLTLSLIALLVFGILSLKKSRAH